jgi:hypothetical protein
MKRSPLENFMRRIIRKAVVRHAARSSCSVPCSPSDFCTGGKCERHGCFRKGGAS